MKTSLFPVRPLPPTAVSSQTLEGLLRESGSLHRFNGAGIAGNPPLVLFRVETRSDARRFAESSKDEATAGRDIFLLVYGWDSTFGGTFTLTLTCAGKDGPCPGVCLTADTPAFRSLQSGKLIGVIAQGENIVRCLEFDLDAIGAHHYQRRGDVDTARPSFDSGQGIFRTQWARASTHRGLLQDPLAAYWDSILNREIYNRFLSRNERLSIGWVGRYSQLVSRFARVLADARAAGPVPSYDGEPVPDELVALIEAVRSCAGETGPVLQLVDHLYDRSDRSLRPLLTPPPAFFEFSKARTQEYVTSILWLLLLTYFRGSRQTRCGRVVPILRRDGTFTELEIDPGGFPDEVPVEEYWKRLPVELAFDWEGRITGADFPVDLRPDSKLWKSFPLTDDVPETEASADALLDEAVAAKQWTIPPEAMVDLPVGPFTSLEAFETPSEVIFVCRTPDDQFATAVIQPDKRLFIFSAAEEFLLSSDEPKKTRLKAALKLLLSAVLRDFWVVEERDAVFSHRYGSRLSRLLKENEDRPRIVYLPRIRYTKKADVARCGDELGHHERRAHFVRAHLRKSECPSEQQLLLAHRYGLIVPIGYTFVRPHERGKLKRDVLYRSRSALRSLYTALDDEKAESKPAHWFKFEREVRDLMEKLGFRVQHVSASGRGDRGVDIYATKGSDLEEVNWIIQCKCYHPKRKVGPSVIRELIGTLEPYPRGTRGMVVTTARFSPEALDTASQAGIRVIDGVEYLELLEVKKEE